MSFRTVFSVLLALAIADLVLVSARSSLLRRRDGALAIYMCLAAHELVLLLQLVCLGVLLSRTFWVSAGLVMPILHTARVVGPLFLVRVFLTAFPCIYRDVLLPQRWGRSPRSPALRADGASSPTAAFPRAWTDGGYGVLVVLDLLFSVVYLLACVHAGFLLTEKTLYAPYNLRHGRGGYGEGPLGGATPSAVPAESRAHPLSSPDAVDSTSADAPEISIGLRRPSLGAGGGALLGMSGFGFGGSVSAPWQPPPVRRSESVALPSVSPGGGADASNGSGSGGGSGATTGCPPSDERASLPPTPNAATRGRPASSPASGTPNSSGRSTTPTPRSSAGAGGRERRPVAAAGSDTPANPTTAAVSYGLPRVLSSAEGRPSRPGSEPIPSALGPMAPLELHRRFTLSSTDAPGYVNAFAAALVYAGLGAAGEAASVVLDSTAGGAATASGIDGEGMEGGSARARPMGEEVSGRATARPPSERTTGEERRKAGAEGVSPAAAPLSSPAVRGTAPPPPPPTSTVAPLPRIDTMTFAPRQSGSAAAATSLSGAPGTATAPVTTTTTAAVSPLARDLHERSALPTPCGPPPRSSSPSALATGSTVHSSSASLISGGGSGGGVRPGRRPPPLSGKPHGTPTQRATASDAPPTPSKHQRYTALHM